MAGKEFGSLTKEPPLATLDAVVKAAVPGMAYAQLLAFARRSRQAHSAAPGLVSKRFLLIDQDKRVAYDHFLSLTKIHPLDSPLVRKVMYFVWAYRDERIRRFICERVADRSGRWRSSQLLNKANAKFFERWLKPGAARKARSNFEYFLCETQIFDKEADQIHLELSDGWLEQAAIAAAQHERDPNIREELLASPIDFLKSRNWLGLLNADTGVRRPISPILISDSIPLEDETINATPAARPVSREWDRTSPRISQREGTTHSVDLVTRERANKSHHSLEKELASIARRHTFVPKYTQNIDVYFDTPHGTVLTEVKSCTDTNFHSQVRKGISQLFEYRFLYEDVLKPKITMLLLMETKPPRNKRWLVDYISTLGVILAWRDQKSKRIGTTSKIPATLSKILVPFS